MRDHVPEEKKAKFDEEMKKATTALEALEKSEEKADHGAEGKECRQMTHKAKKLVPHHKRKKAHHHKGETKA
jgi:hypothetical protein